jgi:hypothetical protein
MKQLTFDEIMRAAEKGEQLTWHPEYDHQGWKDGEPPLTIVHCSFLGEFKDKMTDEPKKHYFVGYSCSKEGCGRCSANNPSTEVGPHHNIIMRSGLSTSTRVEFIETKKKTLMKEHKNPVFVRYEEPSDE